MIDPENRRPEKHTATRTEPAHGLVEQVAAEEEFFVEHRVDVEAKAAKKKRRVDVCVELPVDAGGRRHRKLLNDDDTARHREARSKLPRSQKRRVEPKLCELVPLETEEKPRDENEDETNHRRVASPERRRVRSCDGST